MPIITTRANAGVRGYQTKVNQRFHADSCDVVGLMCLQTPKSGGISSVVSTVAVHNEMVTRRPDLAEVLAGPTYWDRRGEVPEGKDPWYVLPVFNYTDGYFSCRYGRQYIDSTQRFEQVPRTTPAQAEALDMMDSLLAELKLDMEFQIGDIQFLFNHVMLHSDRRSKIGQNRNASGICSACGSPSTASVLSPTYWPNAQEAALSPRAQNCMPRSKPNR